MRCKKHPCDFSSSVGVCAPCLRDRLNALIAAQAQVEHAQQQAQLARAHSSAVVEDSRKSDSQPPPLLFPRSVSPYVARRKSDDASRSRHLRFYSTPQVGPTYSSSTATEVTTAFSVSGRYKKKHSGFSLLSSLFRSRSEKLNPDPTGSSLGAFPRDTRGASSSSPFWFSTIFSGRRKKQSTKFCDTNCDAVGSKPHRMSNRGMSPARGADSNEDCEDCDRSPSASGYSSESSQGWRRTPVAPSSRRRGKPGHVRNMSGFTFCLSPLVRASPNGQWNHKGGLPPDTGFPGEIRAPVKPHLSTAASFCANRSRKLADFGRVNRNR